MRAASASPGRIARRWLPALLVVLAGCGPRTHLAPARLAGDDAYDVVKYCRVHHGVVSNRASFALPAGSYRFPLFVPQPPGLRPLSGTRNRIHPILLKRLALGPSNASELVQVTFFDTLRVPRFPSLAPWKGFTRADTAEKLTSADSVMNVLRGFRAAQKTADSTNVVNRFAATVVDNSFLLTRSLVIGILRDSIPSLARLPGVVQVRPAGPAEPPPQMNNASSDDPARVRGWVGADAYATALPPGRVALLDTGLDSGHEMFPSGTLVGSRVDMVNVSSTGAPPTFGSNYTEDLSPGYGHGTMSVGIMVGHPPNDAGRGLTSIPVDVYRVYAVDPATTSATPGLVGPAVERSLLDALESYGGVITIEAQAQEPDDGGIALAAEQAFDGGAVVVAANGNSDAGSSEVRSPANARRVLGIGAYSVRTGETLEEQIQALTADDRVKPDVQAPSSYETGCKGPGTNEYAGHGGTSGATAVAGAAAALMRSVLLDDVTGAVDPGFVYAGLIAGANGTAPFDAVTGGGKLKLPDDCAIWKLKLSLSNAEEVPVSFDASAEGLVGVRAAIWWPERVVYSGEVRQDAHSKIGLTLEITDSHGKQSKASSAGGSVFQRITASTSGPVTSLVARVKANSVVLAPQDVYLVVIGQRAPVP